MPLMWSVAQFPDSFVLWLSWGFSCYRKLYVLNQYHKHQLFWNKTKYTNTFYHKIFGEGNEWRDWKSERAWCFENLFFDLLLISVVTKQVNLVSLLLSDMKFSGIFFPFLVSFSDPTLGWQWMMVVDVLEGVISLFLCGCLGLEYSEVASRISRRNLSNVTWVSGSFSFTCMKTWALLWAAFLSPLQVLPCRSMSKRLASWNTDLGLVH